jgi:hypothetical protein
MKTTHRHQWQFHTAYRGIEKKDGSVVQPKWEDKRPLKVYSEFVCPCGAFKAVPQWDVKTKKFCVEGGT